MTMFLCTKDVQDTVTNVNDIIQECNPERMKEVIQHCVESHGNQAIPKVDANADLWDDCGFLPFFDSAFKCVGTKWLAKSLFFHPTPNAELLRQRQQAILSFPSHEHSPEWIRYEKDVLWLLSLPSLKESETLRMVFPHAWFVRPVYKIPQALALYHFYRGYVSPALSICTPATTIFGPYIYIRKNLAWKISLHSYFQMLWLALRQLLKPSWNLKQDLIRYVTLFLYAFFFLLNIIQTFEIAKSLRKLRASIQEKWKSLKKFVATFSEVESTIPEPSWKAFHTQETHAASQPRSFLSTLCKKKRIPRLPLHSTVEC